MVVGELARVRTRSTEHAATGFQVSGALYSGLPRGKAVWAAVLVALLFAVSIYPIAATRVRVEDRFEKLPPTDDGMAYMKTSIYSDDNRKVDWATTTRL